MKKHDGYQDEGKVNGDAFKRNFSHDLDGLGRAMKDLTMDTKQFENRIVLFAYESLYGRATHLEMRPAEEL